MGFFDPLVNEIPLNLLFFGLLPIRRNEVRSLCPILSIIKMHFSRKKKEKSLTPQTTTKQNQSNIHLYEQIPFLHFKIIPEAARVYSQVDLKSNYLASLISMQ